MNLPGKWRRRLRLLRSATHAALPAPCARRPGQLRFQCNVCSAGNVIDMAGLSREAGSCRACGSTVRFRAMIAALSLGLYGEHRSLGRFDANKAVRGIGMSDWVGYADRLERLFDYTNTFYDAEPRLDITAVPPEMVGTLDFILSSDVFEHVAPPVGSAFENARRLLKPGGLLVLTVPYRKDGPTEEHFPNLYDFEITHRDGRLILFNTTRDGRKQVFEDLVFHGGPGQTLEMRVFSEQGLLDALGAAGFTAVSLQSAAVFEHGIWWADDAGVPVLARA